MVEVHITSVAEPIASTPRAVELAIRLVARGQAMGLLPAAGLGGVLDEKAIGAILERLAERGIAQQMAVEWTAGSAGLVEVLEGTLAAVDDSPQPEAEWPAMRELLGDDALVALTGVSPASLRRYASGSRATPDEVAFRLHQVARAVAGLLGSYNAYGVRRWFERPRPQLDGRTPGEVIASAIGEDDPDLLRTIALADALIGELPAE